MSQFCQKCQKCQETLLIRVYQKWQNDQKDSQKRATSQVIDKTDKIDTVTQLTPLLTPLWHNWQHCWHHWVKTSMTDWIDCSCLSVWGEIPRKSWKSDKFMKFRENHEISVFINNPVLNLTRRCTTVHHTDPHRVPHTHYPGTPPTVHGLHAHWHTSVRRCLTVTTCSPGFFWLQRCPREIVHFGYPNKHQKHRN